MAESDSKKEITTTVRWGAGIILTIVIQTFGVIWYFAQMDSLLNQHTTDIAELKSGASVFISKEDLEALLGGRDQRITNIEASMVRIENKLDRVLP